MLCDGEHLEESEAQEREVVDAVATQTTMVSRRAPRADDRRAGARSRPRRGRRGGFLAGARAAGSGGALRQAPSSTAMPSPEKQTSPAIFIASARGSS